ncbi:sodium-coupled monocarboxylate transporter 1-like [Nematolebias whitei]|uniref:sodium-coupled monocarboxylate transporter 1-like n=1 Tax=Nematolebias whitei TaxID=451745 RepID=UPI0018991EF3|nr:sodium-coupled monocarboxylate transporter 1-like [Nematolebias whitei]
MSGYSQEAGSFGPADYTVFVLMLVVSSGIGIYYGWVDRRKRSSSEFLIGKRTLTALPVSMSLTAGIMSSTTILSSPAEVYRFGAIFGLVGIAYALSMVVTSEIFLPVFYRLGVTSTYEYLELRFNKATRLLGTAGFLIHITMFAGITVYGPALALNKVVNMSLWTGIVTTAMVCTFYCTLGGIKAVVWTDVFQIGIMLMGFLAIISKAVILQGVSTIFADAQQGGRLNFWDFDINPLRRHTFWTLVIGGTFVWSTTYGVNPPAVQRYNSCRSITQARLAVYINLFGLWACLVCTVLSGLSLYSVYKNCDPWTAGLVSSPDQLIPHLVMDIFTNNPGLSGLFLAAVYSGSLSTVSSCINSLAAVTLEDLIKPHSKLSENQQFIVSKALNLFYGLVCIAMAGIASFMGGMLQAAIVLAGVTGGPLFGLFSLGMLCPFANSKGGLSGLVIGFVATLSVSLGDLISHSSPEMTRPLPLTTEGCNFTTAENQNCTSTVLPTEPSVITTTLGLNSEDINLMGKWSSPSYLYFSLIGSITVFTVGVTVSILTGGCRDKVERRLTLQKEDTTVYHLFRLIKDFVTKGADRPDLTVQPEGGNLNPAFCDSEIYTKTNSTSSNF